MSITNEPENRTGPCIRARAPECRRREGSCQRLGSVRETELFRCLAEQLDRARRGCVRCPHAGSLPRIFRKMRANRGLDGSTLGSAAPVKFSGRAATTGMPDMESNSGFMRRHPPTCEPGSAMTNSVASLGRRWLREIGLGGPASETGLPPNRAAWRLRLRPAEALHRAGSDLGSAEVLPGIHERSRSDRQS